MRYLYTTYTVLLLWCNHFY